MITDSRRYFLDALAQISDEFPEFRFGQLIANPSYLAREPSNGAIRDAEDEELLAAARQILTNRGRPVPAEAK
jgi:hypothetical protein